MYHNFSADVKESSGVIGFAGGGGVRVQLNRPPIPKTHSFPIGFHDCVVWGEGATQCLLSAIPPFSSRTLDHHFGWGCFQSHGGVSAATSAGAPRRTSRCRGRREGMALALTPGAFSYILSHNNRCAVVPLPKHIFISFQKRPFYAIPHRLFNIFLIHTTNQLVCFAEHY